MNTMILSGERYASKVAALFPSREDASRAAAALAERTAAARHDIHVIAPDDPAESRKLEPEPRGIARTLIRAHLVLGLGGALGGATLAGLLMLTDIALFSASPWLTVGGLVVLGALAGLLLGGLVALRPDHDRLNMRVQEATNQGDRWAVVVHVRSRAHEKQVQDVLAATRGEVLTTP